MKISRPLRGKNQQRMERKGNDRLTPPFLTKFELSRLLGTRSLCLALNNEKKVNTCPSVDSLEISKSELKERKIPLRIRRHLPDGSFEDWSLDELAY